ncbi:hypothetical protein [Nocardiopsis sp. CNT312]|nr:hypothetical protein [Nocardiopsis sp. CNT312]
MSVPSTTLSTATDDLFTTPETLTVPDQAHEYTKTGGDSDVPTKYDEI